MKISGSTLSKCLMMRTKDSTFFAVQPTRKKKKEEIDYLCIIKEQGKSSIPLKLDNESLFGSLSRTIHHKHKKTSGVRRASHASACCCFRSSAASASCRRCDKKSLVFSQIASTSRRQAENPAHAALHPSSDSPSQNASF